MYEGYEGYDYGYVKTYPKTETASTTKKEPIERKTLVENAEKEVLKCLEVGKNIVFMEPPVDIKMKQLMALAGDKEIFGKLLIHEDDGYLTIKDILVPEQSITGSTFNADKEDIGKFMYSLFFKNNDPATKIRRTPEEVEAITKNLSGHFHSHNSINSSTIPSPSGVDTDDMNEQVEGRDYWIEIIGTMAGYSGRILINTPINKIWGNVEVKIKWWAGIKKTLDNLDGKLSNKSYSYTYNSVKPIKKGGDLETWDRYKCEGCQVETYGSYLTKINGKYLCVRCEDKIPNSTKWKKSITPSRVVTKPLPLGKVKITGGIGSTSKRLEAKDLGVGSGVKSQYTSHRKDRDISRHEKDQDYCEECDKLIIGLDFEVVGEDIYCLSCTEKLFADGIPEDEDYALATKTIKEATKEIIKDDVDKEIDKVMKNLTIIVEHEEDQDEGQTEGQIELDYMPKDDVPKTE